MDLRQFIEARCERNRHKTMINYVATNTRLTYGEVDRLSSSIANGLLELGVRKGESVCVMMPNSPDWICTFVALVKIGAIVVPVNTSLRGEGLLRIVTHSDAKTIFLDESCLSSYERVSSQLSHIDRIVMKGHGKEGKTLAGKVVYIEDLLQSSSNAPPLIEGHISDSVAIIYTSGTTGTAKGVVVPQNKPLTVASFISTQMKYNEDDVIFTALPLFHGNALWYSWMPAVYSNATFAFTDRFSVSRFWDMIRKSNASEFNYVGSILPLLFKAPANQGDKDHRVKACMGAAAPKQIWQDFEKRFNLRIIEIYATTETTIILSSPYDENRVGSCGKPTELAYVTLVDDDENECPPGIVGEIVTRPKKPFCMMTEYYKEPEKTLQAFRNLWQHTGDLGMKDSDGWFFFVGRKHDYIRRRGENISAYDVETIMNAHPKILESAVVGVPSELGEEDIMACIVQKPGEVISPEELLTWCEDRMAYFMVPRYIQIRDTLPKTPTERVEKYKLRAEGVAASWDRDKTGYKLRRT